MELIEYFRKLVCYIDELVSIVVLCWFEVGWVDFWVYFVCLILIGFVFVVIGWGIVLGFGVIG